MEKIVSDFAEMFLEDDIIFGYYKRDVVIDLQAAEIVVQDRKKLSKGNMPVFIDARHVKTMTKEARKYFGTKEGAEGISAAAIFTDSVLNSFIANFLVRVNLKEQHTIVKAFTDKEKAIQWLNKYK